MKLIWNIFLKDVRHNRVKLALWLTLIAATMVVGDTLLSATDPQEPPFTLYKILILVGLSFTYLLTASVLLSDPVEGSQMFWATRPVSGRTVLGAKLMWLALVLVGGNLVILTPWFIRYGFGFADVKSVALNLVYSHVAIFGVAALIASVTGNSRRFTTGTLVLILVVIALGVWSTLYWKGLAQTLKMSRMVIFQALAAITGLVVVWHQYQTRRTRRSLGLLSIGVLGCLLVFTAWPWDFEKSRIKQTLDLIEIPEVAIELRDVVLLPLHVSDPEGMQSVVLNAVVTGMPSGTTLERGIWRVNFSWRDGTTVEESIVFSSLEGDERVAADILGVQPPSPPIIALKNSLTGRRVMMEIATPRMKSYRDGTTYRMVLTMDRKLMERFGTDAPACRLAFEGDVLQGKVVLRMPLEAGHTEVGEGVRAEVNEFDDREFQPGHRDSKIRAVVTTVSGPVHYNTAQRYFALDRSTGRLATFSNTDGALSPGNGVRYTRKGGTLKFPSANNARSEGDNANSPVGFDLVIVNYDRIGRISTQVDIATVPALSVNLTRSLTNLVDPNR
jgi:hypothetical protein